MNNVWHGITRPMGTDFQKAVELALKYELDYIELYMLPEVTTEELRTLRQHNLQFQIHEIPTNPLHRCKKYDKDYIIAAITHWIDQLHEFEGNQLIIHAPQWNYNADPIVMEGLIDGMNTVYDYARSHDVQISLELLEGFYYSHFRYFEQHQNWKDLQLTYDFRRSPYRGRTTPLHLVQDDLQAFAHRISNFHTFYIGMGTEVKGGIGPIPTAERTTNFKHILEMLKFMEWPGTITCENPNLAIAAQMAKKSRELYDNAVTD